jgi:hypothetical protein
MEASGAGTSNVRVANVSPGAVAAMNGWNHGKRGAPGARMATRHLAHGDIVCLP